MQKSAPHALSVTAPYAQSIPVILYAREHRHRPRLLLLADSRRRRSRLPRAVDGARATAYNAAEDMMGDCRAMRDASAAHDTTELPSTWPNSAQESRGGPFSPRRECDGLAYFTIASWCSLGVTDRHRCRSCFTANAGAIASMRHNGPPDDARRGRPQPY